jgi:hypothetical protein
VTRDFRLAALLVGLALLPPAALLAPPAHRSGSPAPSWLGQGPVAAWADNAAAVTLDDAGYYLVLAENVARGHGPTLDGHEPTSGYHPLWLLVLLPTAVLAPAHKLLVAAALQALLVAAGALAGFCALRASCGAPAALLGSLLWLAWAVATRVAWGGLEWSLQALLLLLVAGTWARDFAEGWPAARGPWRRLGLLLALASLARLEALALLPCLLLVLVRRARGGRAGSWPAPRAWLALAGPPVLAALLWGGVNVVATGHPLPVSAALKGEWSQALLDRELGSSPRRPAAPLATLAARAANLAWPVTHQRRAVWLPLLVGALGGLAFARHPRGRPWAPFALYAGLQVAALNAVYYDGYAWQAWYFVAPPWLACVLLAEAGRALARAGRAGRLLVALATAALLAFVAWDVGRWRADLAGRGEEPLCRLARLVRESTPADARIGAWNAGLLALLSGRSVTNLDGLASSREYAREGRRQPCAYWRRAGLTHLADVFPAEGVAAAVEGPLDCAQRIRPVLAEPMLVGGRPRLMAIYRLED